MLCDGFVCWNGDKIHKRISDITTVGNGVAFLLAIIVAIRGRIKFSKSYWTVLAIFFFYGLLTTINNGSISPLWLTKWPLLFTYGYILCQSLKGRLLVTIEQVLFILCMIAIGLWLVQVISPNTALSIVKRFEFSVPFAEDARIEANMLVFTLNANYTYAGDFFILPRNAGFAWEAGAFGSLVCVGIFCNMMRKEFSFTKNIPLYVFVVALLSTQSTTALSAFVVGFIIWLLINKKLNYAILLIPFILWVYSLPFVSEKAMTEYGNVSYSIDLVDTSHDINRMQSLVLSFYEFKQHFILGLGGDAGGSVLISQGFESALFSGIGELLARYGIIITILFFIALLKSCKSMSLMYNTRTAYCFSGILIAIMFSFSFWNQPIFICLWLYCMFEPVIQNTSNNRMNNHYYVTQAKSVH